MRRSRCTGPRARAVLGWTLAFVGVLHLVLNLFLEARHPEIYDPEFRDRLVLLRQRIGEQPDRPLLLVVGSSRITTDFRPETLPELRSSPAERPTAFNFSHSGAGPLLNLMEVRRLLREGIHPRWMVVEVVPSLLGVSGQSTAASLAGAGDLPLLSRYVNPMKLSGCVLWKRARICLGHRQACVRSCAPWLLTHVPEWDSTPLEALGGAVKCLEGSPGADEVRRRTQVVRRQYFPGLQHLGIHETPDRALHELLGLCQKEQIEVVLLLAPESSVFRGWYTPETWGEVDRCCAALSRQYGTPVINARQWLPDAAFADGHHATPAWAAVFTRRLGKEVLQPLVEGRWRANDTDRVARK